MLCYLIFDILFRKKVLNFPLVFLALKYHNAPDRTGHFSHVWIGLSLQHNISQGEYKKMFHA